MRRQIITRSLILSLTIMALLLFITACQEQKASTSPFQEDTDPDFFDTLESPAERQIVTVLYDDTEPVFLNSAALSIAKRYGYGGLETQQAFSFVDNAIINAQHIANLVQGVKGHWAETKPVSEYQLGDANLVKHTFYMGSTFDNPVPDALIQDVMSGSNVTWLHYNIWQLNRPALNASLEQLGLEYLEGLYFADPNDAANSFNTIEYNGYDFKKVLSDLELNVIGLITPTNPNAAAVEVLAEAKDPNGNRRPYALKSGNFWYIADSPFSYVYERDRYLVFADLVPKMLGVDITCEPRALIRIEDVTPNDSSTSLARIFDVFTAEQVPFGIATVAIYENQPQGITLNWGDNPAALAVMLDAQNGFGQVLQHGYTHTTPNFLNPVGISGVDWEFWNINENVPLPNLSPEQALARVKTGQDELLSYGLWPRAWVTPHYAANPSYYPKFKEAYWRYYERRTLMSGNISTGQFFPYPVRDINDRALVLPENTNFVSEGNLLPDILETGRANLALSCPWMGMFMHPFLLDPSFTGVNAVTPAELTQFIADVRALGYTFVTPTSVRRNPVR